MRLNSASTERVNRVQSFVAVSGHGVCDSNGVRRAKAALLAGHMEIECQIIEQRRLVVQQMVPLTDLRSPKSAIEIRNPIERHRYERILQGTKAGVKLPPLEISPGNTGWRLKDVGFVR